MRQKVQRWVFVIGLLGALGLSGCSLERVAREIFDGALSGASGAVEDAVSALVGDALPPSTNGG
ncbi:MAG: hypothetical protein AABZ47_14500 [Planctomycetota bacterium]